MAQKYVNKAALEETIDLLGDQIETSEQSSKDYADEKKTEAINNAVGTAEQKDSEKLQVAKNYADLKKAEAIEASNTYADNLIYDDSHLTALIAELQNGKADKSEITAIFRLKDDVATIDDLPLTDNKIGDVRKVIETEMNYHWKASGEWDELGGLFTINDASETDLIQLLQEQLNLTGQPKKYITLARLKQFYTRIKQMFADAKIENDAYVDSAKDYAIYTAHQEVLETKATIEEDRGNAISIAKTEAVNASKDYTNESLYNLNIKASNIIGNSYREGRTQHGEFLAIPLTGEKLFELGKTYSISFDADILINKNVISAWTYFSPSGDNLYGSSRVILPIQAEEKRYSVTFKITNASVTHLLLYPQSGYQETVSENAGKAIFSNIAVYEGDKDLGFLPTKTDKQNDIEEAKTETINQANTYTDQSIADLNINFDSLHIVGSNLIAKQNKKIGKKLNETGDFVDDINMIGLDNTFVLENREYVICSEVGNLQNVKYAWFDPLQNLIAKDSFTEELSKVITSPPNARSVRLSWRKRPTNASIHNQISMYLGNKAKGWTPAPSEISYFSEKNKAEAIEVAKTYTDTFMPDYYLEVSANGSLTKRGGKDIERNITVSKNSNGNYYDLQFTNSSHSEVSNWAIRIDVFSDVKTAHYDAHNGALRVYIHSNTTPDTYVLNAFNITIRAKQ